MCRDVSNYLMALPCMKEGSSEKRLELDEGGHRDRGRSRALLLLSAMEFAKLQICYFGNMAFRSSLLFALTGSVLVAVIPALIASESS